MDTQSSGPTLPPPPVANEEGSVEGWATDEASQDCHRPTNYELFYQWSMTQLENEVLPTVVVDEDYRQLFYAALVGRWKDVEQELNEIRLNEKGKAIRAEVMTVERTKITVLDIAVIAAHDRLVENLAKLLDPNEEEDIDIIRRALRNAARGGGIRMVKALVNKIKGEDDSIGEALSTAVEWAPTQKDVILYLANRAPAPNDVTMNRLIMAGHLDIACHLTLKRYVPTPNKDTKLDGLLENLVSMTSYFRGRARLSFWEKSISKCFPSCLLDKFFGNSKTMKMNRASSFERIAESKSRHEWSIAFGDLVLNLTNKEPQEVLKLLLTSGIVIDAASRGIAEFVKLFLEYFPELMWEKKFTKSLITEVLRGRHVELFRLLKAHSTTPYLTDDKETRTSCLTSVMETRRGLMAAVVEWSPGCISKDVSGAAFLTQRELQWFKVVEDWSDPSLKSLKFKVRKVEDKSDPSLKRLKLEETKERTGKTFWEVFVDQRQDLLKEARQWMKDTSSSCSLVATLITTVAFAVAFTVPGGNQDERGTPIFLHKDSFLIFAIADALALFSSVTATLMFLAILTSRYAIEDFLHSLPRKMILGLTFLFLSLAFMMMAFGSALTIVLNERFDWIYIPITLLAALPVILFAILQLPLYVEMVESTFRPPLYRPMKIWK